MLPTVNSLSGGKTSSYLAAHYPADYDVFALVCIDAHNAGGKIDKKVKQLVNDKLQKHCPHMPEFVATSEDPKLLNAMLDLEQLIGREITWLRGMSWEDMMFKVKKIMPNRSMRICTSLLKVQPIFEFLYMQGALPCEMRIGYRWDEKERANDFNQYYHFSPKAEFGFQNKQLWLHRWVDVLWRYGAFPLIDNKVSHYKVYQYWLDKGIDFPSDSNCSFCFWKPKQQLRKNFDTNLPVMAWAMVMETLMDHTFLNDTSLMQISRLGLQLDFNFGTGSGCQAGFCTD
jgi:hypothetical protein